MVKLTNEQIQAEIDVLIHNKATLGDSKSYKAVMTDIDRDLSVLEELKELRNRKADSLSLLHKAVETLEFYYKSERPDEFQNHFGKELGGTFDWIECHVSYRGDSKALYAIRKISKYLENMEPK